MPREVDEDNATRPPGRRLTRRAVVAGAAWAVPAVALAAPAYAFSTSGPVQATGCAGKLPGGSCDTAGYYKQGYRFYFRVYNPPGKTACITITAVDVNGVPPDNGGQDFIIRLPGACAYATAGCCGSDPNKSITILPNHTVVFALETNQNNSANGTMNVTYTLRDANACNSGTQTFSVSSSVNSLSPPTGGQCAPFPIPTGYGCTTIGTSFCI